VAVATPRPRAQLKNKRRVYIATAIVVIGLGFVVFQGLGNATVYFKTADEAVAQKAKLGSHRFRVEGVVADGSVRRLGNDVAFTISNNNVDLAVVNQGSPPELFKASIPVVLEGRWDGDHFASDRIIVKHSETYRADHQDRVKDYPATTR
jgi:cytochrome c-type biogenesis protein CcmE